MRASRSAMLLVAAAVLGGCTAMPAPAPPRTPGLREDPGPPPAPTPGPSLSEIVYVGSDGNIHTVARDGTDEVQVTTRRHNGAAPQVRYGSPRWSPDGDRLAYLAFQSGNGTRQSRVHLQPSDGGPQREVFASRELSALTLGFSPDGRTLGLLAAARGSSRLQLLRLPHAGDEAGRVVATGRPLYWQFCGTDGSIVAHVDGTRPHGGRVVRIPPGPVAETPLVEEDPTVFRAPACDVATGRVLVGSHTAPRGAGTRSGVDSAGRRPSYVVLTDPAGGGRRLVTAAAGRSAFSISPGGRRAAGIDGSLTRFGAIRGQLWLAELEEGSQHEAVEVPEAPSVIAFFWSPDGSRLAYFQPAFDAERTAELLLWLTVLDLADDSRETFGPLYVSPAFANEVIYRFDQFARHASIWAPDGSALTMGLIDATGRPGVYVVPTSPQGGGLRRVGSGDLPVWRPGPPGGPEGIATLSACYSCVSICIFRQS